MHRSVTRTVAQGLAATSIALLSLGAFAADKPMTASQQKMSDCSKANAGKKGDEYKSGVKACLSGTPEAAPVKMTQQQKMSMCSKQNAGKKGDDYKSGVKACLSA